MAPIASSLFWSLLPTLSASETILGVYMFHRHGDRTAKATAPSNLTDLGYQEVFTSGNYFRDRYVSSNASSRIMGLNSDQVKLSQLTITAPVDNVLVSSAMGFSQALYPATPSTSSETLRNGTVIQSPMNGYQLIPIGATSTGAGSEDSGWLQDATDCGAAEMSSNDYFSTPEYDSLLASTQSFYTRLSPVLNSTFSTSQISYKNAYTIFDYINVGEIHNATIPGSDLLDPATLFQLRTLADTHEWNLAYNASSTIRGIAGMQLAAQVVDFLNTTATSNSKPKLGVQFGAYSTFTSFFGLAGVLNVPGAPGTTDDFYGVTDYASAMVWELYTENNNPTYPVPTSDLNVRFMFHNGTTSSISQPMRYPLFNGSADGMPWTEFTGNMSGISVGTTQDWCTACENTTGSCLQYAPSQAGSSGSGSGVSQTGGSGISNAVAGVIGAMVTLGVIFLIEAAILVLGGLRLVRKRRAAPTANGVTNGGETKA